MLSIIQMQQCAFEEVLPVRFCTQYVKPHSIIRKMNTGHNLRDLQADSMTAAFGCIVRNF